MVSYNSNHREWLWFSLISQSIYGLFHEFLNVSYLFSTSFFLDRIPRCRLYLENGGLRWSSSLGRACCLFTVRLSISTGKKAVSNIPYVAIILAITMHTRLSGD